MPITPFHFGPGALVKSAVPRHFSFTVFAFSQVLIDVEPIGLFVLTGAPIHPYLHTYVGAMPVFLASWWAGRPAGVWALRAWNRQLSPAQARWLAQEPEISSKAAGTAAFIGAYSHVAIDSIMHGDMEPFAPFSGATPWLHVVSLEAIHWACVAAGIIGIAGLLMQRWKRLRAGRPSGAAGAQR